MSASDTLRRAATELRFHAAKASDGRWQAKPHGSRQDCQSVKSGERFVAMYANRDASYMALVDPAVGVAVADWLDLVASKCEEADRYVAAALGLRNVTELETAALAVARTILREADDATS